MAMTQNHVAEVGILKTFVSPASIVNTTIHLHGRGPWRTWAVLCHILNWFEIWVACNQPVASHQPILWDHLHHFADAELYFVKNKLIERFFHLWILMFPLKKCQAFARTGSPKVTRWLLPERTTKPRLMCLATGGWVLWWYAGMWRYLEHVSFYSKTVATMINFVPGCSSMCLLQQHVVTVQFLIPLIKHSKHSTMWHFDIWRKIHRLNL